MGVQGHDNDTEPCLLVAQLVLTVYFKCVVCQRFFEKTVLQKSI